MRRIMLDAPQTRGIAKADSALAPFAEFSNDILGKEDDRRVPPDQLVFIRLGIGHDQPKHRRAIGRSNRDQTITGRKAQVQRHIESKLLPVELQAAILIANVNIDRVNAQVGVLPVEANVHASGLRHFRPGNRRKS